MRLRTSAVLFALAVLTALLLAWRFGYFELTAREQLIDTVRRARQTPGAEALYVAGFVVVVVLALPATIVSVLGGALFGPVFGLGLAWIGAMSGSAVAHVLARSVGRTPARKFFGRHPLLGRLRDRVDLWTLIRLRVLPIAPFGVLNYVAGLAGVKLRVLLLATGLGILPGTAAYVYAGYTLARAIEQGGESAQRGLRIAAAITAGLVILSLASVFFSPGAIRLRRSRSSEGEEQEPVS